MCHDELAAQVIDGILMEQETNRPIDLGLVMLSTVDGDSVAAVLTDRAGWFRVESPQAGEFLLSATALGYATTVASSVFTLTERWTDVAEVQDPATSDRDRQDHDRRTPTCSSSSRGNTSSPMGTRSSAETLLRSVPCHTSTHRASRIDSVVGVLVATLSHEPSQ